MKVPVLIFVSFCVITVSSQLNTGVYSIRTILKVGEECSRSDFVKCLKKKAITFLDRLGHEEKLTLMDGVAFVRPFNETNSTLLTEDEIDRNLARSLEDDGALLNKMLIKKAGDVLGSRSIEVSIPKVSDLMKNEGKSHSHDHNSFWAYEEPVTRRRRRRRPETHHHPHHHSKLKAIAQYLATAATAALAALVPVAIAIIGLIAGGAAILAKVALAVTIVMAALKLMPPKKEPHIIESHIIEPHIAEPHVEPHIVKSQVAEPHVLSGHDDGYNYAESWTPEPSGGGWDQRYAEEMAQLAAYKGQKPF